MAQDAGEMTDGERPHSNTTTKQHGFFMATWMWIMVWVQAGVGMFTQSYYIFTTGQVKSLWQQGYPTCWEPNTAVLCPERIQCLGTFTNTPAGLINSSSFVAQRCDANQSYPSSVLCNAKVVQAVAYTEFAGIMAGMLTMGFIAVRFGLKWTSVLCIAVMGIGAVLMTASSGATLNGLFLMFVITYSVFGFGVGGEYVTAAVGHTERHEEVEEDAHHGASAHSSGRGRAVQLMFSMQGWGAVIGSVIICICLAGFEVGEPDCTAGGANEAGYNQDHLESSWRLLYGLGLIPIAYALAHRIFQVEEVKHRAAQMEAQDVEDGEGGTLRRPGFLSTLGLFLRTFWLRLAGTAFAWFMWDTTFYGNKLFSAPIFASLLGPQAKLLPQNLYILLNNVVALVGYWLAALVIDWPWVGRVRLQAFGFLLSGLLFLACGLAWDHLPTAGRIVLYLLTSLFGQLGPNATTFVLPSESFPSEVRTIGHAISAVTGKAGALMATVVFVHFKTQTILLICAGACLLGVAITILLCCNLNGLDLKEQEKHWVAVKSGKRLSYTGEAVNPIYLSYAERFLLRWGRAYIPPNHTVTVEMHAHAASTSKAPGGTDPDVGELDVPKAFA